MPNIINGKKNEGHQNKENLLLKTGFLCFQTLFCSTQSHNKINF